MGEVPDSLPVTDETRERLREQANQLARPTVIRLIDLLHAAVEDMRQGGDPRLPLELALVKATRPGSDLSRESLAHRLELLEGGQGAPRPLPSEPARAEPAAEPAAPASAPAPEPSGDLALEQLQEAWQRTILPAVEGRSIPTAAMLREARPAALAGDRLTVEFPAAASFQRGQAEEPTNATLLQEALFEVTGRRLALEFELGEHAPEGDEEDRQPRTEDEFYEFVKETLDAREVEEER
jgi:DNA polymerase III gamma/tau subunit